MDKYRHSKIYKLYSPDGFYYLGSTVNTLRQRKNEHKSVSKKNPNQKIYAHFNTIGWDTIEIVLVEEFKCENRDQLRQKENEHIVKALGDPKCLNSVREFITEEERKEQRKQIWAVYYENHKEELQTKALERYHSNPGAQRIRRANKKSQNILVE